MKILIFIILFMILHLNKKFFYYVKKYLIYLKLDIIN